MSERRPVRDPIDDDHSERNEHGVHNRGGECALADGRLHGGKGAIGAVVSKARHRVRGEEEVDQPDERHEELLSVPVVGGASGMRRRGATRVCAAP